MLTQDELDNLGVWDWDDDGFPPYWEQLRRYIFKRDGYRCKSCHKVFRDARKLDAHHITFRQDGGSDNPRNLATVCEPCHNQIHLSSGDEVNKRKTRIKHQTISHNIKFVISALLRDQETDYKTKKAKAIPEQKTHTPIVCKSFYDEAPTIPDSIKIGHTVIVKTKTGSRLGIVLGKDTTTNRISIKIRDENKKWIVISRTTDELE